MSLKINSRQLPEGWTEKKFGNICENLDSKRVPVTKSSRESGNIPYYGASGIVDYVADYIFDEDLLLVSEDGANLLARTYPIAFSITGKTWVNNHAHVLRFTEKITRCFTEYYLNFVSLEPYVSGMAQPKLNQTSLNTIAIPMPPFSEQKRIVAIVDQAFEGIDRAIVNTKNNLTNARELFESYLNTIFIQKGDGWVEKKLKDVCEVKDGTHDSPKYITHGIPFVTQKNIRETGLTFEKITLISSADHQKFYTRSNVAFGDVLISMIGANRGMACIVDDTRVFSIKNVGLIKASENISRHFLLYFLKSKKAQSYVESASRGGAQPFIGLGKLRELPVSVAPQHSQAAIVTKLDELHNETQRLEAIYQQKLAALNELKQSILQKAFTGELTADTANQTTKKAEEAIAA